MDTNELRELFLQAEESQTTRVLAIALSIFLLALVLWLVRRRTLREEYTPIWVLVSLAVLVATCNLDLLRSLTRAIGAWTVSSTLFLLSVLFLGLICLNYAVKLSRHSLQLKNLAQETALLERRAAAAAAGKPNAGCHDDAGDRGCREATAPAQPSATQARWEG